MKPISFMTIGDSNFFHTIRYSVEQVAKLYPGSETYVYDMGFTTTQKEGLEALGATVIHWQPNENVVGLGQFVQTLKRLFFTNPRWVLRQGPTRLRRNLSIFAQKPMCIHDCVKRADGNVVFLDGDAFLVSRIDEVFEQDFNVGVTMRRMNELKFLDRDGECRVLNVGVMFFHGDILLLDAFFQRWMEEVRRTTDYCIEQTAVTNILSSTRSDIFNGYGKTGVTRVGEHDVKVKVFSCEEYNFNWIEEGFDPTKNKILHFKGGRHTRENFDKLMKEIEHRERVG